MKKTESCGEKPAKDMKRSCSKNRQSLVEAPGNYFKPEIFGKTTGTEAEDTLNNKNTDSYISQKV